jgi:hypothetical protein
MMMMYGRRKERNSWKADNAGASADDSFDDWKMSGAGLWMIDVDLCFVPVDSDWHK